MLLKLFRLYFRLKLKANPNTSTTKLKINMNSILEFLHLRLGVNIFFFFFPLMLCWKFAILAEKTRNDMKTPTVFQELGSRVSRLPGHIPEIWVKAEICWYEWKSQTYIIFHCATHLAPIYYIFTMECSLWIVECRELNQTVSKFRCCILQASRYGQKHFYVQII